MFDAYRVKKADWFQDYRVYSVDICREVEVSEEKLDMIMEKLMELKILPEKYEYY